METEADVTRWRQDDPRWNKTEAWPRDLFPEVSWPFFREAGCLVCSLAVLLRCCGLESSEAFTPWELNRKLIGCGAFSPAADLRIGKIRDLYPLAYQGPVPYSREALVRLAGNGFPCLITVPGIRAKWHFLALLRLLPEDAAVYDPLSGEKRLSEYSRIGEIRWFRFAGQDAAPGSAGTAGTSGPSGGETGQK